MRRSSGDRKEKGAVEKIVEMRVLKAVLRVQVFLLVRLVTLTEMRPLVELHPLVELQPLVRVTEVILDEAAFCCWISWRWFSLTGNFVCSVERCDHGTHR